MKLLLLLAACVALTWAAPTDSCFCEAPSCLMELKAECECRNSAATTCWRTHHTAGRICPAPRMQNCAFIYSPIPTVTVTLPAPAPPKVPDCTCEPVMCAMSWPESCRCQNNAAAACAAKCGGPRPQVQSCTVEEVVREVKVDCVCEEAMCVQSWPESCYCENAKRTACLEKCGGKVPTLMNCGLVEDIAV